MTLPVNPTESARWAIETQKAVGELQTAADKAFSEAAARGFPSPPGVTLQAVLDAGNTVKLKLTEVNGDIYDKRRGVLFQQIEFEMGITVKLAKLAMELYREEILNALAIEQEQVQSIRDMGRADVERLNSETDLRQATIIRNRAEAEQQVIVLKSQLVAKERESLGLEEALIYAQLQTAEKKLEIIDSIYKVLAAEQLVLAAEQRRAAALQVALEAQRTLANVKRSMIPFYEQKADARVLLADAITEEIPIKKAIEELGFDRIALKTADEGANHAIRLAQLDYELAREVLVRATKATELLRAQARRILQEYSNKVRETIIQKKEALEKNQIRLRLDTAFQKQKIAVDDEVEIEAHERANLSKELANILKNMVARALDQAETIKDGAVQISKSFTTSNVSRKIVEGFFVGPAGPG